MGLKVVKSWRYDLPDDIAGSAAQAGTEGLKDLNQPASPSAAGSDGQPVRELIIGVARTTPTVAPVQAAPQTPLLPKLETLQTPAVPLTAQPSPQPAALPKPQPTPPAPKLAPRLTPAPLPQPKLAPIPTPAQVPVQGLARLPQPHYAPPVTPTIMPAKGLGAATPAPNGSRVDLCGTAPPIFDTVFAGGHLVVGGLVALLFWYSNPKVIPLTACSISLVSSLQFVLRPAEAKEKGRSPTDAFQYPRAMAAGMGALGYAAAFHHAALTLANWSGNPIFTAMAGFCAISSFYMAWRVRPNRVP